MPVTVTGTAAIARRSRRRQLGVLAVSTLALIGTVLWQQGRLGLGAPGASAAGDSTGIATVTAPDANASRASNSVAGSRRSRRR